MKRRSLLKMLGVSPALLAPWTPATEKIAPPPAPPAEPEKLTLEEAMRRVDWDTLDLPLAPIDWGAVRLARVNAVTGCIGYRSAFGLGGGLYGDAEAALRAVMVPVEDDDGPV